jgi:hypothetical protein
MTQIAAEEEMAAVREWAVAGAARVDRLREAPPGLAYARNADTSSRMSVAYPALRFSARSARRQWLGNKSTIA